MSMYKDQDVLSLLKDKGLNDEDGQFWLPYIRSAPEETQPSIIEFLTTIPGSAEWLRVIQEEKERALSTGDRAAWDRIIEQEAATLSL